MESHNVDPARRDVIKAAAKLPFIAPLITTFTAADALAAGSNHSCYELGHRCNQANEPCCPGLTCVPQGAGAPRCE
jgi:hypothetical protein